MSLFKSILSAAAPLVGSLFGPTGAAIGGVVGKILAPKSKTASIVGASTPIAGTSIMLPASQDWSCYLQNNPDVAADAFFGARPDLHYEKHGRAEGRSTACATPQQFNYGNSFAGGSTMSLLPAIVNVGKTLPTIMPGVGNVIRSVGGAIGGALIVDQLGNVIGRTRKRRSMNVLNPKAASRSIRRIKGLRKFAQRIERSLPKQKATCSTRSKAKCR